MVQALLKLFSRVDANCDGSIDWDEFSQYMLLESQGTAQIRDVETGVKLSPPANFGPVPDNMQHTDSITHISMITAANGQDRYVTCGKDGFIRFWNVNNLQPMRSIQTGKSWVTCAKVLPTTKKLAVTSFSRSMKIYDLVTFEQCGQIQEIDYAPMAMDVWTPRRNKEVEMVVFGDGGGFVRLYELKIDHLEDKNSTERYIDTPKWKFQHHSDWVTCIKYVQDMNCVIAGSLDKLISITDAEDRVPLKVLQGHQKGVICVDWSGLYKVVCSGGQDKKIILWNPFSCRSIATLSGHEASVVSVVVSDQDNMIFSLDERKNVRIWDIRNHRCLQSISDKTLYPDNTLASLLYDAKRKQCVTGNQSLKVWKIQITILGKAGHSDPVQRVLYNPTFQEAISGDQAGTLVVWFIPTGRMRFKWSKAHGEDQLTAMAFDKAKRKLISGSDKGEVKVWNWNSGAVLTRLKRHTHQEITAIAHSCGALFKNILVAGWDRDVTYFQEDGSKEILPGRRIKGHAENISDMAVMETLPVLCVALEDGDVYAWNVENGAIRKKMTIPSVANKAPNERPAEALAFLFGPLKHVLVVVYADRFMRLWDIHSHSLILECWTGHLLGETVLSLAIKEDNTRIATADSSGYIKIWDCSSLQLTSTSSPVKGNSNSNVAKGNSNTVKGEIVEINLWRGHKYQVTSLQWVDLPEGLFLLSSSHDKQVRLWHETGALVGILGESTWDLKDEETWKAREVEPLDEDEEVEMDASSVRPEEGTRGRPSTAHLSSSYGFARKEVADGRKPSAPPEVLKVLEECHRQRLSRVASARIYARAKSGQTSRAASAATGRSHGLSPRGQLRADSAGSLSQWGVRDSSVISSNGVIEEDDEEGDDYDEMDQEERRKREEEEAGEIVESEASSPHDSDDDVPTKLWLTDFESQRHQSSGQSGPKEAIDRSFLLQQINKPRSPGAIAGLMKAPQALAEVPTRPSTSYSSKR